MSDLADALQHIGIDTIAGRPVADWLADNINDLPGHYFTVDSLAAALPTWVDLEWWADHLCHGSKTPHDFAAAILKVALDAERVGEAGRRGRAAGEMARAAIIQAAKEEVPSDGAG